MVSRRHEILRFNNTAIWIRNSGLNPEGLNFSASVGSYNPLGVHIGLGQAELHRQIDGRSITIAGAGIIPADIIDRCAELSGTFAYLTIGAEEAARQAVAASVVKYSAFVVGLQANIFFELEHLTSAFGNHLAVIRPGVVIARLGTDHGKFAEGNADFIWSRVVAGIGRLSRVLRVT